MAEEERSLSSKKTIGVCVVEKKVFSAPMGVLERLEAFGEFEARLHEIIMFSRSQTNENGHASVPWMIDGSGLPPNASELLPKVVNLTKKVTAQVELLAKDEDAKLAETDSCSVLPQYDQAKALGTTKLMLDALMRDCLVGQRAFS